MRNRKIFLIFLAGVIFSGCKKNPVDRLINPVPEGDVAPASGVYSIYNDEFKTSAGIGLIPGGENQTIELGDAIRYFWNGADVPDVGVQQHLFAGYSVIITPDFTTFDAAQPRNLNAGVATYAKLKFLIRGTLASDTYVRIEGPDDGSGGIVPIKIESLHGLAGDFTLTDQWQEKEIVIPSNHFDNVKVFFTLSLQYSQPSGTTVPGGGGTIYIDQVRYEQ